jgi:hypothetical protein
MIRIPRMSHIRAFLWLTLRDVGVIDLVHRLRRLHDGAGACPILAAR